MSNEIRELKFDELNLATGGMTASGPELGSVKIYEAFEKAISCFLSIGYMMGTPSTFNSGGPCPKG